MRIWPAVVMLGVLGIGACAMAQENGAGSDAPDREPVVSREVADTHPDLSGNDRWAKRVVEGILVMFAAAALVGPWVRKNVPKEVPPAHSHDEPPGTSHHHGRSGEIQPEPHD